MKDTRQRPVCSRGQWAVQRERCRLDDRAVPQSEPELRPLGEMLPAVMRSLGLEQVHWSVRLEADWPAITGAVLAAHTRPGTIRDGVLTIFVDSSVWLSELARFGRKPLLDKLQAAYGAAEIRDIRLQLDPD